MAKLEEMGMKCKRPWPKINDSEIIDRHSDIDFDDGSIKIKDSKNPSSAIETGELKYCHMEQTLRKTKLIL